MTNRPEFSPVVGDELFVVGGGAGPVAWAVAGAATVLLVDTCSVVTSGNSLAERGAAAYRQVESRATERRAARIQARQLRRRERNRRNPITSIKG
jgi:hypothetical protein